MVKTAANTILVLNRYGSEAVNEVSIERLVCVSRLMRIGVTIYM